MSHNVKIGILLSFIFIKVLLGCFGVFFEFLPTLMVVLFLVLNCTSIFLTIIFYEKHITKYSSLFLVTTLVFAGLFISLVVGHVLNKEQFFCATIGVAFPENLVLFLVLISLVLMIFFFFLWFLPKNSEKSRNLIKLFIKNKFACQEAFLVLSLALFFLSIPLPLLVAFLTSILSIQIFSFYTVKLFSWVVKSSIVYLLFQYFFIVLWCVLYTRTSSELLFILLVLCLLFISIHFFNKVLSKLSWYTRAQAEVTIQANHLKYDFKGFKNMSEWSLRLGFFNLFLICAYATECFGFQIYLSIEVVKLLPQLMGVIKQYVICCVFITTVLRLLIVYFCNAPSTEPISRFIAKLLTAAAAGAVIKVSGYELAITNYFGGFFPTPTTPVILTKEQVSIEIGYTVLTSTEAHVTQRFLEVFACQPPERIKYIFGIPQRCVDVEAMKRMLLLVETYNLSFDAYIQSLISSGTLKAYPLRMTPFEVVSTFYDYQGNSGLSPLGTSPDVDHAYQKQAVQSVLENKNNIFFLDPSKKINLMELLQSLEHRPASEKVDEISCADILPQESRAGVISDSFSNRLTDEDINRIIKSSTSSETPAVSLTKEQIENIVKDSKK